MIHFGAKGAVVVDEGVLSANPEICGNIIGPLPKFVVPAGESTKSRMSSGDMEFLSQKQN